MGNRRILPRGKLQSVQNETHDIRSFDILFRFDNTSLFPFVLGSAHFSDTCCVYEAESLFISPDQRVRAVPGDDRRPVAAGAARLRAATG